MSDHPRHMPGPLCTVTCFLLMEETECYEARVVADEAKVVSDTDNRREDTSHKRIRTRM